MSYTAACEGLRDEIAGLLERVVQHTEDKREEEASTGDLLEDLCHRLDVITDWLTRDRPNTVDAEHFYHYPMNGERTS